MPITTATAKRTFSVLRRLKTYLQSTMSQERLNNVILLHIHKDITDSLDLTDIARSFLRQMKEDNDILENSNRYGSFLETIFLLTHACMMLCYFHHYYNPMKLQRDIHFHF